MICPVSDWDQFMETVSWFLDPGESAVVGDGDRWPRGPVAGLPVLSGLLSTATITSVSVGDRAYELLAWGLPQSRRGWLCLPPVVDPHNRMHPIHRRFLSVCGGILERFGEPRSWWNNQNEVLTEAAASMPVDKVLADYAWLWSDLGLDAPIEPDQYHVAAVEANGNLTLVHRNSGRLVVFSPDHAFEGVTALPGCPPYSLMAINDVPDLTAWIENCAAAWSGR
jgi:hypothetical protein